MYVMGSGRPREDRPLEGSACRRRMRYEHTATRTWTRLLSTYGAHALDAMVILAYVAVVDVLLLEASLGTVARAALGLPLIVFLPGYAMVTALFPRTMTGRGMPNGFSCLAMLRKVRH